MVRNSVKTGIKEKTRQLTLFDVSQEIVQAEPAYLYATEFFALQTSELQLENFNISLNKSTRRGPKYSSEEKKALKVLFIQKKMKPVSKKNITAEEYYTSKRSLAKKVFDMDVD
jgi:hypothetical protein